MSDPNAHAGDSSQNHLMLSDKNYEFTKRLVQIILPAVSALYFGLASIWGLPAPDKVTGTIAVVTTFLGVILGISSSQYNKSGAAFDGAMVVTPGEEKTLFSLELKDEPEDLVDKNSIRFKVRRADRPLRADTD